MRIRVTTKASLFEERKRQHIECGYRIEDEQPVPINGFCSFVVVDKFSERDALAECVAQALRRDPRFGHGWCDLDEVQQSDP